jgi:hypothetical protein
MNLSELRGTDGNKLISAGRERVTKAIVAQGEESFQSAVRSFNWAIADPEFKNAPWSETIIHAPAFSDSPSNYLSMAGPSLSNFSEMVSMEDVLNELRKPLNYQSGVKAFLKSGIQEALAGIKLAPTQKPVAPTYAQSLNELFLPENLKSTDPIALQSSVHVIQKMFSTLRNMDQANHNIKVNMAQFLRC